MPTGLAKIRFAPTDFLPSAAPRPMYWLLALLSLVPLCIVLPMASTKAGIAILAAWVALLWVAISFARDQFHYVVPVWVAVYPYCYYFLSYPAEHSIFTVDRALVALLVIEMILASCRSSHTHPAIRLTHDMQFSAYLWGIFLVLCFLSLVDHNPAAILPSYRFLVDGMLMPALLGLYAARYFPLPQDLRRLHTCACVLGIGLFLTGLIEVVYRH